MPLSHRCYPDRHIYWLFSWKYLMVGCSWLLHLCNLPGVQWWVITVFLDWIHNAWFNNNTVSLYGALTGTVPSVLDELSHVIFTIIWYRFTFPHFSSKETGPEGLHLPLVPQLESGVAATFKGLVRPYWPSPSYLHKPVTCFLLLFPQAFRFPTVSRLEGRKGWALCMGT